MIGQSYCGRLLQSIRPRMLINAEPISTNGSMPDPRAQGDSKRYNVTLSMAKTGIAFDIHTKNVGFYSCVTNASERMAATGRPDLVSFPVIG